MAFTPFSAKNAMVRINGVTLAVKSWNVDAKADEIDTTNTEGGGFYEGITGIESAEVTLELDVDSLVNPYDNPPNLGPGQVTEVKLYWNGLLGPFWYFPKLLIFGAPNKANVKEAVGLSIRGKGNGIFGYPSGQA